MNKVLITGGAGFIGSQLGHYLDKNGYDVYLLDNMKHGHLDNLEIDGSSFGTLINADIRDKNLTQYTDEMDYVVHLAGLSSLPLCQSNVCYGCERRRKSKCPRFLQVVWGKKSSLCQYRCFI